MGEFLMDGLLHFAVSMSRRRPKDLLLTALEIDLSRTQTLLECPLTARCCSGFSTGFRASCCSHSSASRGARFSPNRPAGPGPGRGSRWSTDTGPN